VSRAARRGERHHASRFGSEIFATSAIAAKNAAKLKNSRFAREVKEIRGEFVAIDAAFNNLKAGELCLILIDQVEEAFGKMHEGKVLRSVVEIRPSADLAAVAEPA